jgi:arabinogalactan oligomer / maltooligosaccharide transport system permease protein
MDVPQPDVAMVVSQEDQQKQFKKQNFRRLLRESGIAWLYILPAGILMLIISFSPQLYQVWMSFTDYRIQNLRFNIFNPETFEKYLPTFVGLENYVKILTSNLAIENYNFTRLLTFNIVWTVTNVLFHVVLGVAIALALNYKHLIGRRIYRALFILPWAIPGMITAVVWRNMYDDRFGAFNLLLARINEWLGTSLPTDTRWLIEGTPPIGGILSFLPLAFYAVLMANIWLGWPFMSVVATGALQSIPSELYEAASIDGASGAQQLRNITIPLIRPAMVPAIMLGTIWTFNNFNVIYFISQGGPFGRTEILVTQAFKLVYEQRLYGVAAAFSIVVFFILLFITLLQNRVTRATEAYNE